MDFSLILSWFGVSVFFLAFVAAFIYVRANRYDHIFSNSYYVLGMIQSYCYIISILTKLLLVDNPLDQLVISQGVYAIITSLFFMIEVLTLIRTKYDFFTTISTGVKLVTILAWVASNIVFVLVTEGSVSVNLEIEGIKTQEFFFIDFFILIVTLTIFVDFIKCKKEFIFLDRMSNVIVAFLFIGSSFWTSSILYDILTIGPFSLLNNMSKACISFLNFVLSLYIISINTVEYFRQRPLKVNVFHNLRGSFASYYDPANLVENSDGYLIGS